MSLIVCCRTTHDINNRVLKKQTFIHWATVNEYKHCISLNDSQTFSFQFKKDNLPDCKNITYHVCEMNQHIKILCALELLLFLKFPKPLKYLALDYIFVESTSTVSQLVEYRIKITFRLDSTCSVSISFNLKVKLCFARFKMMCCYSINKKCET